MINICKERFHAEVTSMKAIVFISHLLQLFQVCRIPNCGSCVDQDNIKLVSKGAHIHVSCICNNHHEMGWDSGPLIGSGVQAIAIINILLSTFSLTIGLHFQQVQFHNLH